ncbi:hypothetical protein ACIOMM_26975 [Streptomyces sp. NPDC087908]|uniref:hypothetical protein n=1 Tax=Streptomyces sp. NPDC087908 TaxID=3365820 RepID=UPI0038256D1E
MSRIVQHRVSTATATIRAGLDYLLLEVRIGLDAADQRHLLHRLYDPANGGTGLLPLLGEVLTAVGGAVREWQPNHEATVEALDEAAACVADSAGQRINAARNLLTRPAEQDWPTPEQAYAKAPSTVSEVGWTARTAADRPFGTEGTREFWLRKAALLDRIALADESAGEPGDATEAADRAARRLMDVDDAAVICNPRHYVRQQYALWTTHQ